MGLLIVPSIFFREVDRLAFDSSVFSAVLQTEGWLLKSLVFTQTASIQTTTPLTMPIGCNKFFFFLQVMESLTTLHLHVLRYKRELLFDLVTAWDISPGFACESSDCCTNTALFPGIQTETSSCRAVNPISPWLCTISKPCPEELLTRVFGTEGKKNTNS